MSQTTDQQDIYKLIKADHRKMETLLNQLVQTQGASDKRARLFDRFAALLVAHANAEERSLYARTIRDKDARAKTSHGAKEHCQLSDLVDELRQLDHSSPAWLVKMKTLRHDVLHHNEEEEEDLFPKAKQALSDQTERDVADQFLTFRKEEKADLQAAN